MPDETTTEETSTEESGTTEQSVDSLPDWARKQIGDLRAESARYRTENRTLKPLASEAQRLRDAQKPVEEQAAERIAAAEKRASEYMTRAAGAELRALAAPDFANADDALRFVDVADVLDGDGNLDRKAAAAALKSVLDGRTYLRRTPTTGSRAPAYQAGQGSTGEARPSPAEQMNAALRQAAGRA